MLEKEIEKRGQQKKEGPGGKDKDDEEFGNGEDGAGEGGEGGRRWRKIIQITQKSDNLFR